MNKTNHIILTIALCFFLVFAAYPLRTFATLTAEQLADIQADLASVEAVTNPPEPEPAETPPEPGTETGADGGDDAINNLVNMTGTIESISSIFTDDLVGVDEVKENDQNSVPSASGSNVGDIFIGPTGTEYELKPLSPAEQQAYADAGISIVGDWVPIEESSDGGNDKGYSCSGAPNYTCSEKSNGTYSSLSACQSNCKELPTITPPGSTCSVVYSYTPCSDTNPIPYVPPFNHSPPSHHVPPASLPASPPPASPPPASSSPICQIRSFTINEKDNSSQDPLIVWVNASLRGYFSVNDTCKTCTVSSNDTWGSPPKTYSITTLNSSYTETFKIITSGTYSYTLECKGADPEDIDINTFSLQTVKALNLPWWREIIPNLGGFLRGL